MAFPGGRHKPVPALGGGVLQSGDPLSGSGGRRLTTSGPKQGTWTRKNFLESPGPLNNGSMTPLFWVLANHFFKVMETPGIHKTRDFTNHSCGATTHVSGILTRMYLFGCSTSRPNHTCGSALEDPPSRCFSDVAEHERTR